MNFSKFGFQQIVILLVLAAVIAFAWQRRKPSPPPAPPIAAAVPIPATPTPAPESTPSQARASATPEVLKATVAIQPRVFSDILCLREDQKVFYLPRQLALPITRGKQTHFYIPHGFGLCLAKGSWKFWISEFDGESQLPFRYYFEMTSEIVEIGEVDPKDQEQRLTAEAKAFKELFGEKWRGQKVLRVQLKGARFDNFKFDPSARPPYLLADPAPSGSVPDGSSKPGFAMPEFNSQYLPPSHALFTKALAEMTEATALTPQSPVDLSAESLSHVYFRKFGKIAKIHQATWPESKAVRAKPDSMIRYEDYRSASSSHYLLDTRALTVAGSLTLKEAKFLPWKGFDSRTTFEVNRRFERNSRREYDRLRVDLDAATPDLKQVARTKTIVLMGHSENDPMPAFIQSHLSRQGLTSVKILKEGFHPIFMRAYFFNLAGKTPEFKSVFGAVDPVTDPRFATYLLSGHLQSRSISNRQRKK
jgi:hypothetical protein